MKTADEYRGDMTDMPCKRDCPDRKSGCHAVCERGLAWEAAHKKKVEAERKQKQSDWFLHTVFGRRQTWYLKKSIDKRKDGR